MKNIAVMTPSLNSGGAERIAGLLSKYLTKYYNVYVFVDSIENQVYEYGGKLVYIGADGAEFREYNMQYYKKLYKIDCAISFLEWMNFANIRTRCHEKIIVSERCTQSLFDPPYYHDFGDEILLYNWADKVVAVAEGVKYDLIHNYGIESSLIDTIYNFIDQDKILKRAKEKLPDEIESFIGNSKLIINIGRLDEQKNQKKLLMQFSLLLKDGIDAKLIIIGSGPLKKQLLETIENLKIEENVKIVEYNSNPFPYYRRADVFALSSSFEGLPNVILEAMTLTIPVVSTDCLSGPRELLLDSKPDYSQHVNEYEICERGILVTTDSTENNGTTTYYKDALKKILENSDLRKSIIDNQKTFMSKYTNQSILQKWINVIEEPFDRNGNEFFKDGSELSKQIILYGAGWLGKRILPRFLGKKDEMELLCFAVSSLENNRKEIAGIPVYQIDQLEAYKETADVIVSIANQYDDVVTTLKGKGFKNLFIPFISKPSFKDYLDYKNLDESAIKKELSLRYLFTYGEKLKWDNPQKYSEKIQTLKLCSNNRDALLLDKYYARKYVAEKIGEQYLPDFFGIWKSFKEIDFEELPNSFTLVCTHGKDWEINIQNKEEISLQNLEERVTRWLSLNYAYTLGLDQRYREIFPKIIAEKREYDDTAKVYKFLVFNEKVKMIEMDDGQLVERDIIVSLKKEALLSRMVDLAEKIGKGTNHIVVEFKTMDGRIFFHNIDLEYGDERNPIDYKEDIKMGHFM